MLKNSININASKLYMIPPPFPRQEDSSEPGEFLYFTGLCGIMINDLLVTFLLSHRN